MPNLQNTVSLRTGWHPPATLPAWHFCSNFQTVRSQTITAQEPSAPAQFDQGKVNVSSMHGSEALQQAQQFSILKAPSIGATYICNAVKIIMILTQKSAAISHFICNIGITGITRGVSSMISCFRSFLRYNCMHLSNRISLALLDLDYSLAIPEIF